MQLVQDYFNEITYQECGICDVCIEKRKKANGKEFDTMRNEILMVMKIRSMTLEDLEQQLMPSNRELFVDVVRDMVDDGTLEYDSIWKLNLAGNKQ